MQLNWKKVKTPIPHQPYHIIDDNDQVICTIYHHKEQEMIADIIVNAPQNFLKAKGLEDK